MSFINPRDKEINCKIVYCGPAFAGKSTTIRQIYDKANGLKSSKKERMMSLTEEKDRTLYFDFLPLDLGEVKGFRIRLHLYSVPGQALYANNRKIILKGVDGIIFVADSQIEKMESNLESLSNLQKNLEEIDADWRRLPFAFQYNKRDLGNAAPVPQLRTFLNPEHLPDFESIATEGGGVMEGMQSMARRVLQELKKQS